MTVFLIGYMACGKTTLGRALEEAGVCRYIDLDDEIGRLTGLTPSRWIALHGESAFRQVEIDVLEQVCRRTNEPEGLTVVGCGGGTPCNAGAMDLMLASGCVVWLIAGLGRTIARLLEAPGQRPLVADMDADALARFVPRHLASRVPFYALAPRRFCSTYLDTTTEIARTVEKFKTEILANPKTDN